MEEPKERRKTTMSGSRSRLEKRPLVAPHIASLPKSGIRDFFDLVSTMKDVINDNNAPMGTRPAMNIEIGADVNYSIQSKGSCKVDVINKAAQKEIVMDDNGTHHIVSRDEASGQLSMFNNYDEYIDAVKNGKY